MRNVLAIFILASHLCASLAIQGCVANPNASTSGQRESRENDEKKEPIGYPVDISFTDTNNGWVAYKKSVWKLSKGGQKWELRMELSSNNDPLLDISYERLRFQNTQRGWLNSGSQILETQDEGVSWVPILQLEETDHINDVSFLSARDAWIVGGRFASSSEAPLAMQTTNGGQSWRRDASLRVEGLNMPSGVELYTIQFINANTGWISGSGAIWATKDGGKTWRRARIKISGESDIKLSKLQFLNETQGYAHSSPVRGAVAHNLVRTTDGGRSWQVIKMPLPSSTLGLTDFHFRNFNHGFAIFQGAVFETDDGGEQWKKIDSEGATGELLFFLDRNHGWIAGKDGLLIRTNDAGKTWQIIHK